MDAKVLEQINGLRGLRNEPPMTMEEADEYNRKHTIVLEKPIHSTELGESIMSSDFEKAGAGNVIIPHEYCERDGEPCDYPQLFMSFRLDEDTATEFIPMPNVRIKKEIPIGTSVYFMEPLDMSGTLKRIKSNET